MKIYGKASSTEGFSIDGFDDNYLLNSGYGVTTLDPSLEISTYDGAVRFNPKEIEVDTSNFHLTDDSRFVILIYTGTTDATITFDPNLFQTTVYVINTTSNFITMPVGAIEGDKFGQKYYCSKAIRRWIYMGMFDTQIV